MTFKNKNILVVGLARSGTGAANLLVQMGARVSITDRKERSSLERQIEKLSPLVRVIEAGSVDKAIRSADMMVLSPGVPLGSPLPVKAGILGVPVIGELELAYQALLGDGSRGMPSFIGITGTNGKSTTTTLIDRMLRESGFTTLLGGNIGSALTEEVLKASTGRQTAAGEMTADTGIEIDADYIVAEISSFQLESTYQFHPKVSAILNITPDHLDRYDTMKDYMSAKARIFENQTAEDYLVLNADDPGLLELIDEGRKTRKKEMPRVLSFSRQREVEGVYCKDGAVYINLRGPEESRARLPGGSAAPELIKADDIKIKGAHNLENAMAASLVALLSGCAPEAITRALRGFAGLEHRLEFVADVKGVRFINDSKGTNVGAVAKSLEDLDRVILIMGGQDKGNDFSLLRHLIKEKVRHLVLMGEAQQIIADALGGLAAIHKVSGMKEAVALSFSIAESGDVVLLSPGCASFDMFADFEDRGRTFKAAVRELAGE